MQYRMTATTTVDQARLPAGVFRTLWWSAHDLKSTDDDSVADPGRPAFNPQPPGPGRPAQHASTLCSDGLHRPLFDFDRLDIEAGLIDVSVMLGVSRSDLVAVNSSTNWHIYAPTVAMDWNGIEALLADALDLGVINRGWHDLSLDEGCFVRLPHVRKRPPRERPATPIPSERVAH